MHIIRGNKLSQQSRRHTHTRFI